MCMMTLDGIFSVMKLGTTLGRRILDFKLPIQGKSVSLHAVYLHYYRRAEF